MPDGITWHVVGAPELEAKLTALGEVADAMLEAAGLAAALPIENAWKENVLERAHKTGTYLRSIHSAVLSTGKGSATIIIGTDIDDPPYPVYLEFGTVKMAPRPTAGPAFDNHREEALTEFGDVLRLAFEALCE